MPIPHRSREWFEQYGEDHVQATSRQLQPDVAFGVRMQLRRKRPKNEYLSDESRCKAEWQSNQKPAGALFYVPQDDTSDQHPFRSDEENCAVVRRETKRQLAPGILPSAPQMMTKCKFE
jgi:hypothetical protein